MANVRLEKIASRVKEELSLVFLHKIQDPQLGLVTITKVKVSPDLAQANVYISVYDRENRELILEKVNSIKTLIRTELAHKLKNMRKIPDLNFLIDDTLDYVEKMENLFKQIHENDNGKKD
ncbi:MAG: 30S ribosome-binding factor RbfA [Melioribacteraceae bacterium]|nr:30S ribosome-binding factor RbfA [Melioribacteraceae bacterium]MCF8263975.1 30S ribosome-binding factor RbfA [Melioribacteraceae bacterium]MCF8411827.1 30S ribosome-binding factor RbfA [Melioribacteraceae bacterium]MCF8432605.1 30S ribosome-binding factor RbfA [Melioribacteraceae bacterium]